MMDQRIRDDLTVCPADQNSEVRKAAAVALGNLGEHAAPAVPALTKLLEGEDGNVRNAAAKALGVSEEDAPAAASASKFGVIMCGFLFVNPSSLRRSSTMMYSTFFAPGGAGCGPGVGAGAGRASSSARA